MASLETVIRKYLSDPVNITNIPDLDEEDSGSDSASGEEQCHPEAEILRHAENPDSAVIRHAQALRTCRNNLCAAIYKISPADDVAAVQYYADYTVKPALEIDGMRIKDIIGMEAESEFAAIQGASREGTTEPIDWDATSFHVGYSRLELPGKEWADFMNGVTHEAERRLGLPTLVPSLRGLKLEQGDHVLLSCTDQFPARKRSPLATLALCLSTGNKQDNDIHVSVGDEETIIPIRNPFTEVAAFTFLPSVSKAEVKNTDGNWVILFYDLVPRDGPSTVIPRRPQPSSLVPLLKKWQEDCPEVPSLTYVLQNTVENEEEANLKVLTKRDQAICQRLYDACAKTDMFLMLGRLQSWVIEDLALNQDRRITELSELYALDERCISRRITYSPRQVLLGRIENLPQLDEDERIVALMIPWRHFHRYICPQAAGPEAAQCRLDMLSVVQDYYDDRKDDPKVKDMCSRFQRKFVRRLAGIDPSSQGFNVIMHAMDRGDLKLVKTCMTAAAKSVEIRKTVVDTAMKRIPILVKWRTPTARLWHNCFKWLIKKSPIGRLEELISYLRSRVPKSEYLPSFEEWAGLVRKTYVGPLKRSASAVSSTTASEPRPVRRRLFS